MWISHPQLWIGGEIKCISLVKLWSNSCKSFFFLSTTDWWISQFLWWSMDGFWYFFYLPVTYWQLLFPFYWLSNFVFFYLRLIVENCDFFSLSRLFDELCMLFNTWLMIFFDWLMISVFHNWWIVSVTSLAHEINWRIVWVFPL